MRVAGDIDPARLGKFAGANAAQTDTLDTEEGRVEAGCVRCTT